MFQELTDKVRKIGFEKDYDLMKCVGTGQVVVIHPEKVDCTSDIVKAWDVEFGKKGKDAKKTS